MSEQNKEVGVTSYMPGTDGFTMACFHAKDVPVGTKLYVASKFPAPIPEQLAQASGIEELTRYAEHWSGVGMAVDKTGEYVLFSQVERLLATQSAKQGALLSMSQRQSFEHWYSDEGQSPRAIERSGEGYKLMGAQSAWNAWKAAYKALDVTGRPIGSPDHAADQAAPLQAMDNATQAAREQSEPAGYISSAAAALIKAKKSGPVSVGVSVSPIHADADVAIYFAAPASTAPKQALSTMADSLPANLVTQVPPNVRDQAPGDSK